MIALVVAVIGLIGTVAAGNAVGEWLKQRSLPEKIKGELAVWSALPDGEPKARLLARIEQRVDSLGVESPRRWRAMLLVFFPASGISFIVYFTITVINGGYSFRRGSDGILRWHMPGDHTFTFTEFVFRYTLTYLVLALVSVLIDVGLKYRRLSRAARSAEQVEHVPRHRADGADPGEES